MKLTKLRIEIGLPKPVRLLHLSDTHLALADGRDNERKRQLASRRTADFAAGGCNPQMHLEEALAYAKEHAELIVHTGDLIDFISYRNLDLAREFFSEHDCVVAAGNHESVNMSVRHGRMRRTSSIPFRWFSNTIRTTCASLRGSSAE